MFSPGCTAVQDATKIINIIALANEFNDQGLR